MNRKKPRFREATAGRPPPHHSSFLFTVNVDFSTLPRSNSRLDLSSLPTDEINQIMSLPSTSDPKADLSHILNRLLRITVPDGRYFIGRFICVDHQLNIVLAQAEEFRPDPKTDEEKENRDRVEAFMPRSQRGAGEGEGWGIYAKYDEGNDDGQEQEGRERGLEVRMKEGRMLGMILITKKDVVTIDLIEEVGETRSESGAAGGMGDGLSKMGAIM